MKNTKKCTTERSERLAVKTNVKRASKKAQRHDRQDVIDELDDLGFDFIGNINW